MHCTQGDCDKNSQIPIFGTIWVFIYVFIHYYLFHSDYKDPYRQIIIHDAG